MRNARLFDTSLFRFLLVGAVNTLLGLFTIYTAKWLLHMGDVSANLLGYACTLTLSFMLNSRWSFRYEGRVLPALLKFVAVIITAYLLNLGVVIIAIRVFMINSYIAQTLGIIPYTLFTYLGSRFIVFKPLMVPIIDQSLQSGGTSSTP